MSGPLEGKARDRSFIASRDRTAGGREIATLHKVRMSADPAVSPKQFGYELEFPATKLSSPRVTCCHLLLQGLAWSRGLADT